jgi:hypothetical protein
MIARALRPARTAGIKVFCFFFFKKEVLASLLSADLEQNHGLP